MVVHGEIARFISGDPTAGNMTGGYLFKMWGLPAAALAMWHAALAGAAYFLCVALGIKHGFTFSHGLIDYIVLFPKSQGALWLLVIGAALRAEGIAAIVKVDGQTLHLLAGLNADQYAAEMRGQLAGSLTATQVGPEKAVV
jgi:phosphotransferase system  glucose/maltose/N-acetylglucosamine-specific IIC component